MKTKTALVTLFIIVVVLAQPMKTKAQIGGFIVVLGSGDMDHAISPELFPPWLQPFPSVTPFNVALRKIELVPSPQSIPSSHLTFISPPKVSIITPEGAGVFPQPQINRTGSSYKKHPTLSKIIINGPSGSNQDLRIIPGIVRSELLLRLGVPSVTIFNSQGETLIVADTTTII